MQYTAAQLSLRGQIAANARWAKTPDRAAAMAPLHRGRQAKYDRQVDPDGVLDPAVRAKLAKNAECADMKKLALARSLAASRAKASKPAMEYTCSWCHPRTAGKSHQTCARHQREYERMVEEVRARHGLGPAQVA